MLMCAVSDWFCVHLISHGQMNKVTWLLCTHAFWQKGDWEWVVSCEHPHKTKGYFELCMLCDCLKTKPL